MRMELSGRRVLVDGDEVGLANKEFELLRVLLLRAGQVVTREEILREVWNDPDMKTSKTLDMHMSWLRRKIGGERRIATVRGRRLPVQPGLIGRSGVRRRILQSTLLVVAITALVLGGPLAITTWQLVEDFTRDDLTSRLEQVAARLDGLDAAGGIDPVQFDTRAIELAVPPRGRLVVEQGGRTILTHRRRCRGRPRRGDAAVRARRAAHPRGATVGDAHRAGAGHASSCCSWWCSRWARARWWPP